MQKSNAVNKLSMTWRTSLVFMVLVTLTILLVGQLTLNGLLPLRQTIDRSQAGLGFIRVWMKLVCGGSA
jgi:hypothetical protein